VKRAITVYARQAGFALMLALFLIVSLAAIAVYLLTVSTSQLEAGIQDEQGARAYQAARAGIDWGAYQVLQNPGGPLATCIAGGAQAPQTLTFTATYLTGFYATVECSRVGSETEGTATVNVYRITSTGCNLATPCTTAQNAPNYVNRQLQLTITRTN